MESPSGIRRGRLLLVAYAIAAGHVLCIFTLGEPYPSLQGPLFAGHLQKDRTIYVPFYRETGDETNLPSSGKLLRHETLGIPAQRNFSQLAPSLSGSAAPKPSQSHPKAIQKSLTNHGVTQKSPQTTKRYCLIFYQVQIHYC